VADKPDERPETEIWVSGAGREESFVSNSYVGIPMAKEGEGPGVGAQ
jgi:hypothetical protein